MNGGYQIVNLKNINFEFNDTFKIDGIYNTIKNTIKPVLHTGIVLGGYNLHNTFVSVGYYDESMFIENLPNYGSGYFIAVFGLSPSQPSVYYFISENDDVTCTNTYDVK